MQLASEYTRHATYELYGIEFLGQDHSKSLSTLIDNNEEEDDCDEHGR